MIASGPPDQRMGVEQDHIRASQSFSPTGANGSSKRSTDPSSCPSGSASGQAGPRSNWEDEQRCNSSSACALSGWAARLWGFHGQRLISLQLLGRKGKLPPTQI